MNIPEFLSRYKGCMPPRHLNNYGYIVVPDIPYRPNEEYVLEEILDVEFKPDLAFKVKLEGYLVRVWLHWATILTLRPYHLINDYVYRLRVGSFKQREILEKIMRRKLFDFIPCKDHLWTKSAPHIDCTPVDSEWERINQVGIDEPHIR